MKNVVANVHEELEFRDNVITFSMEFGHLIALTATQCHIFRTSNWNSPHIFDLKEKNVSLLLQCDHHFLLVDGTNANLYTYDGRSLLAVKWLGMRVEVRPTLRNYAFINVHLLPIILRATRKKALNKSSISVSADTIAAIDANDAKVIHFIDVSTGKELAANGKPYRHKLDISALALDRRGPASRRLCAFIDKNADLYVVLVRAAAQSSMHTVKLAAMVRGMLFNEDANALAAVLENNRLVVWVYPEIAFVDRELLSLSSFDRDSTEFGSKPLQLIAFHDNHITIRRADGSSLVCSINPFVTLLHTYIQQSQWNEALRLCRYSTDSAESSCLWSALAAAALTAKQLAIAEEAFAACNRVEKVYYLQRLEALKSAEAKSAEVSLMSGNGTNSRSSMHANIHTRILFIERSSRSRVRFLATRFHPASR